jgi:hypothetical protein
LPLAKHRLSGWLVECDGCNMRDMADLNVRQFPAEVLQGVKVAAAARGVTLRAFVVEVLTAACGGTVLVEGSAPARVEPRVVRSVALKPRSEGVTTLAAKKHASETQRLPARPDHDPTTCRVYRCGACLNAGYHDARRGI